MNMRSSAVVPSATLSVCRQGLCPDTVYQACQVASRILFTYVLMYVVYADAICIGDVVLQICLHAEGICSSTLGLGNLAARGGKN